MVKYMDKIYRNSVWILISVLLMGYFFYRTLKFSGSIEQTIQDWRTWVHLLFVMFLNVTMVSGTFDVANSVGLTTDEFELADKLNNKIITSVNNEMEGFRGYIKALNEHELISIREDYLFSIGDKKLKELTPKELKKYNKLKPIQHNIYGFNLPLYYEITANGKIEYKASIKKNQGKLMSQGKRALMGLLFGAMTVNVVFSLSNVMDALVSVLVITAGLLATFLLVYFPQVFKFKYELPKKVLLKNTLYNSYVEYKNGTHQLKKLDVEELPKNVEVGEKPKLKDEVGEKQLEQYEIGEKPKPTTQVQFSNGKDKSE
jgi:hypothetical protein